MALSDIERDQPLGDVLPATALAADDTADIAPANDETGHEMTLIEHLTELRKRLTVCIFAVAAASVVAFVFWQRILQFLLLPLPAQSNHILQGKQLLVTSVGGGFTIALMLAVGVGVTVATPVWLYQIWAFIAPGLTRREKKYAGPFTMIGVVLFVLGLAVGFLTLRYPMEFLLSFGAGQNGQFLYLIQANDYFSFVLIFLLAFGLAFELPLVISFMAMIGIVNSRYLAKNRAYILVGLWILSCFVTPGADPYSPVILSVAFTFLYFVTEILIRVMGK